MSGELIATVHYNDSAKLTNALSLLNEAFRIGPKPPEQSRQLVLNVIEGAKT